MQVAPVFIGLMVVVALAQGASVGTLLNPPQAPGVEEDVC